MKLTILKKNGTLQRNTLMDDLYINHGFNINQFKSFWYNITINNNYCFMAANVYRIHHNIPDTLCT